MLKIVKSVSEANLITHGGVFHADDVFGTVIMEKVLGDAKVFRTNRLPRVSKTNRLPDSNPDIVVYDIAHGRFDHHQRGGNGARANGVPYASAGLLWKEFGFALLNREIMARKEYQFDFSLQDLEYIWEEIDYFLISGIDAVDNGTLPKLSYPIQDMNVSRVISQFNPEWDSTETPDEAFLRAVAFAERIFDNSLKRAISGVKARELVEKAIADAKNHVMVLDRFVPWQNWIFKSAHSNAENIMFVVFPSNRGGFNWQCIPIKGSERVPRKAVPSEWWGLSGENLQYVSGVASATFCHSAGFIGGAETLDDAILMARKAIEA